MKLSNPAQGAILNGTGAIPDKIDQRDYKYEMPFGAAPLPINYYIAVDKIENQNGSLSCVGQAWATYLQILEKSESGAFTDLSAKSIYSQIFVPTGGAQIRDGGKLAVNFGVNKEATVSSYNNGVPPNEDFMRQTDWLNDATKTEAKIFQSKEYRTIEHGGNINVIKQAILDNSGVVSGFIVSMEGWVTGDVRPPQAGEAQYGHAVFFYGWEGDEILFVNSWGENWGYQGKGKVDPLYWSNTGWSFSLWTLTDKPNKDMKFVKSLNSDKKLWVILDGKRYWITNPHSLDTIGVRAEVDFVEENIVQYPYGSQIAFLNADDPLK